MNRGEVWWGEDPELGARPHLILSRQSAIPVLTRLLAVPATRTIRGIPTEVPLGPDDGIPQKCVLSLDNTTVIPRSFFVRRITRLRGDQLEAVCRALSFASGCST